MMITIGLKFLNSKNKKFKSLKIKIELKYILTVKFSLHNLTQTNNQIKVKFRNHTSIQNKH